MMQSFDFLPRLLYLNLTLKTFTGSVSYNKGVISCIVKSEQRFIQIIFHTVDGRDPTAPDMYKGLKIMGKTTHQLV